MTTRRRPSAGRSPSRPARRRRSGFRLPPLHVSAEIGRSLFAISLLVLGAVTLIALLLPGRGALTDWWINTVAPWFGTGRWLLPVLLLLAGVYVERSRGVRPDWPAKLLGGAIFFVASLGLLTFVPDRSGGRIGIVLADTLRKLVTEPGAIVVLVGLGAAGVVVAFGQTLGNLVRPAGAAARAVGGALSAAPTSVGLPNGRSVTSGRGSAEPGLWDIPASGSRRGHGTDERPGIPTAIPSSAPVSATFAPAMGEGGGGGAAIGAPVMAPPGAGAAVLAGAAPGVEGILGQVVDAGEPLPRDPNDVVVAGDAPPTRERRAYRLPPLSLLADVAAGNGGTPMDHERNAAIIVAKLASFNIAAHVRHWNAGPVVTQYEVEPDPSIKVSRIESLSDDLAMALAARTIRIEAPIPGRTVVGLEIPNKDFNIVSLRRIMEEVDFGASGSKLTFALGRDVAGHARAADLAKMPHLLIAGATGSGKSVMVNALITSLLCRATPDEVRLILVDLKRVELAPYNGLPHLMVPVITEPERAKAALGWVVNEMEGRYRRFAASNSRNVVAYNESRADPADRLPYLVIIVDELADLMMREGKDVEDPIVRLAQKARATGIHLVLATQRPSVNVVTGLIKANFPSRIAFAMASQIDSRTILDAPGAEDLIGRGDMLFQPADLPKPIRLQGVFVADREITAVGDHWRAEAEPHYDLAIVETEDDGAGKIEDGPDEDADRLLPDAIAVVQEYDRASASLLQRRLRIGYARAARIIDQLEARGFVGVFDGSNARQVFRRDRPSGGRGPAPVDDEDER